MDYICSRFICLFGDESQICWMSVCLLITYAPVIFTFLEKRAIFADWVSVCWSHMSPTHHWFSPLIHHSKKSEIKLLTNLKKIQCLMNDFQITKCILEQQQCILKFFKSLIHWKAGNVKVNYKHLISNMKYGKLMVHATSQWNGIIIIILISALLTKKFTIYLKLDLCDKNNLQIN